MSRAVDCADTTPLVAVHRHKANTNALVRDILQLVSTIGAPRRFLDIRRERTAGLKLLSVERRRPSRGTPVPSLTAPRWHRMLARSARLTHGRMLAAAPPR